MVANLNIRTEKEIKESAEIVLSQLGLTMSAAVNIFLRQVIRENGIPFELKLKEPNTETIEAIQEARLIANDKSVQGYTSIQELRTALDV
ncbi:MAG: type II toxin-antitoxin system RelB/DinJ family antitoxin [Treponema sp.]|nr:type II toxin-antitoxin system RelB/DinJ family antitoxin [Spirochaetia bacterium]MDD7274960.1 type II toxin-antitoxin system RelB/DinJ family antitoxin [Treponema sp.]MDY3755600.1 type II toxin-antitoxin system RelB/DinJ family antitoxin [Treponema sp.]MDY4675052.1 type II toxin-antitoxin system RelB/DinJ family antitoxin [Treponema sp.]MEE0132552.1 type II toxin-antitoxin system RelB/DinJ family antitoxin [Treponema sp.]